MTKDRAKQIVDDMLLVCQKLRSNLDDSDTGLTQWADWVHPDKLRDDLYPWVSGDKDIRPTLIDLSTGVKPITGLTLFNLMYIAHRLCPSIALLSPLRLPEGRELPEPDINWCKENWS